MRAGLARLLPAGLSLVVVAMSLDAAQPSAPRRPEEFTATSLGALDGDSIVVLRRGERVEVRVFGVDAPEHDQPFGAEAERFTDHAVKGREVRVFVRDRDSYGRLVASVAGPGGDLGEALVRAGLAWHFTRYSSDAALARLEGEARAARRGLWSQASPQPPWEHRAADRASPRPYAPGAAPPDAAFIGNVRSRLVHSATCPNARCRNCTEGFASIEQARAAGFEPAGCCLRSNRPRPPH
jgi:endonuclease YncB( thermonuclease family)